MKLALPPLREERTLLRQRSGWTSRGWLGKKAQAVDKRDGPWGQVLISALVISSAGHG